MRKKLTADQRRDERRRYYEKNAEKIRARSRQWTRDNPERKQTQRRAYYRAHRDEIIEKAKAWEAANPERKRERNRVRRYATKYGISVADYDTMLALQGNQCAICPARLTRSQSTHVDHNHATGKVRALLCGACNVAVGALERMRGLWLGAAQAYLSQFSELSILELREDFCRPDWRTDAEIEADGGWP